VNTLTTSNVSRRAVLMGGAALGAAGSGRSQVFDAPGYRMPSEWRAFNPGREHLDGYALDFYCPDLIRRHQELPGALQSREQGALSGLTLGAAGASASAGRCHAPRRRIVPTGPSPRAELHPGRTRARPGPRLRDRSTRPTPISRGRPHRGSATSPCRTRRPARPCARATPAARPSGVGPRLSPSHSPPRRRADIHPGALSPRLAEPCVTCYLERYPLTCAFICSLQGL
jgi:hypothetical protein